MPPKLTTTNDSNGNKNSNNRTNPNQQQQEHLKTKKNDDQSRRIAIEGFAESVHLIQGFADTLDAIPPSLTRSLSDLKELDAVLSTPLNQLNTTLDQLINSLKHPQSLQPSQRLQLLRNMMSDIESYKLGAQDKIRVANGTCESLSHHIRQLDTTTSLLISSLPPSLESRIPPSTFPTGYPKLSGSLRSKPIGGVWQNSNPSNLQQTSPPSISTREFINFHQDSPVRQVYHHPNSNRPFDPQVPLTKRPRLGQFNHPDDDSSLVRRDQADVGGRSSRLLDQHIYSQSVLDKHRAGAQDDHHHHHPSEPRAGNPQYDHHLGARSGNSTGATSSTLARQHSQLGLASPNANNLNAPSSKNKRSRISCGLAEAEAEAEDWSNPGARLNATPQQSAAVGLKKRVRKSNPIGSVGKNADRLAPNLEDSAGGLAKMTDQKAGGTVTSPSPHANKASTIPFAGGTTRKTGAGGVRQTIGNSSKAADGAPVVTKRAYTKRSGLGNTTTAAGGSKGKRGNGKKSGVGTGNEGGSSAETGKDSGTRGKADQVVGERGRKGAGTKEGVRLEDVVEGGGSGKGRGRKTGPHAGDIGTLSRRGGGGLAGETEEVWSNVGGDEWEDDGGSGKLVSQGMVLKGQSSQKGQDDEEGVDSADGGAPPSSESNHSSSAKAYCICRGEVYGDRMVACDNSECPIEWFHYQCAGLTEDPTGNWFCPDCQSKGFGCIT